ncbi:MAG: type II toxin-antitoxin system VapC family toxin [Sulfuriferula sp.]|nr:type II toxin-antitoxin system VapC family toxin [Sulfuriferula sp.]
MILLDTNVLSELMRPKPDERVLRWLDRQPAADLWISAITRAEINLGLALLPDGKRKQSLMDIAASMFIEDFANRCLAFEQHAADAYANIVANRKKLGIPISVEDAQIAAIACVNSLAIATRNIKDFSNIEGLLVIDPWGNSD